MTKEQVINYGVYLLEEEKLRKASNSLVHHMSDFEKAESAYDKFVEESTPTGDPEEFVEIKHESTSTGDPEEVDAV
jgi:hypothetical protein